MITCQFIYRNIDWQVVCVAGESGADDNMELSADVQIIDTGSLLKEDECYIPPHHEIVQDSGSQRKKKSDRRNLEGDVKKSGEQESKSE